MSARPQLIDAMLAIGDVDGLDDVLQRIVNTAATVADCRYAALGVINEGGHGLSSFITEGISDEERALIDHEPLGLGLLGALVRQPHVLRLDNLADDPNSVGFPENHPPMTSFLGVPITVGDAVFGNLYLTEKRGGHFTDSDVALVEQLAVAAGIAVSNARLVERAKRREQLQSASAEINRELLAGTDPSEVLKRVASCARELANSDVGLIAFADSNENFVVEVVDDTADPRLIGQALPNTASIEVPLLGPKGQVAVLVVANPDSQRGFSASVVEQLQDFAGQAALALELAQTRSDSQLVAVFEDRDRIARDLHDTVIQRLFAAGMYLESTGRLVQNPTVGDRINSVVDDLDATIMEIRQTIRSLQHDDRTERIGARARVLGLVDQLSSILGTRPAVHIDGLLDSRITDNIGSDLVTVVREGLSNIARHAHAQNVSVEITTNESVIELVITDDGVGFDTDPNDESRRSGLRNLEERAEQHGGQFVVTSRPDLPTGTRLQWTVPLPNVG